MEKGSAQEDAGAETAFAMESGKDPALKLPAIPCHLLSQDRSIAKAKKEVTFPLYISSNYTYNFTTALSKIFIVYLILCSS